jgi:hypothetical protein
VTHCRRGLQCSPVPGEPSVSVYQFKIVLRGVSPMVWRRLLLRSDHNIADLHYAIQISMAGAIPTSICFTFMAKITAWRTKEASFSATTPSRFAWLTSNFASANVAYTNTISMTTGNTTCDSKRCCRGAPGASLVSRHYSTSKCTRDNRLTVRYRCLLAWPQLLNVARCDQAAGDQPDNRQQSHCHSVI